MGFFVEATTAGPHVVEVRDAESLGLVAETTIPLDGHGLGRGDVSGLTADTEYRYLVRDGDETIAVGRFRTPPSGRASRVNVAIGADLHWAFMPYVAFDRIRERAPTAMLAIGDQVYADRAPFGVVEPTEAAYRELYPLHWADDALASCWGEVPTMLMWDDHEITDDYDGRDATRFAAAAAAYEAYQGIRNPPPPRPSARHYMTSLGPIDVFVLDTRSHRSPNHAPDGPEKSMLGVEQRADLEAFLLGSDAPVKLIASPTPFHDYADTGVDAWAHGFRFERDALFAFIRDEGIEGVVLASGDQHWPAVVRHDLGAGRELFELQCTPTAAYGRDRPTSVGADVLYLGPAEVGFGVLEVDATAAPSVRFAWVDRHGAELFTMELVRP